MSIEEDNLQFEGQFKIYQPPQPEPQPYNVPLKFPPTSEVRIRNSTEINSQYTYRDFPQDYSIDHQTLPPHPADDSSIDTIDYNRSNSGKVLPHKKRITKKLNIQHQQLTGLPSTNTPSADFSFFNDAQEVPEEMLVGTSSPHFHCQLCGQPSDSQYTFFTHLKTHYETSSREDDQVEKLPETAVLDKPPSLPLDSPGIPENNIEFSDTEDMLEGIR